MSGWPKRIVCLTTETTELVFKLGAGKRVAGVSGFSVRPALARKKPRVSGFTSVRMDKIRELKPDLILGFSDLQKDIARDLIGEGYNVFISNQRTLSDISDTILSVGRLIGCERQAIRLQSDFQKTLDGLKPRKSKAQPRVYFEEWDSPMISGIAWVSELIERMGAKDVFGHLSSRKTAGERIIKPEAVIEANPDFIIASWCGKKANLPSIAARPGWDRIEAVRRNRIFEIKSADILSPGLSLLHGARQLKNLLVSKTT